VAIMVMFGIALLEGVATLLGAGLSGFLDSLLPDVDVDVDLDTDTSIDGSEVPAIAPLTRLLGWLRIGKVPVLVLLVVFLTGFGLIGLGMQSAMSSLTGFMLPAWIASVIVFFLALPVVRVFGGALGAVMPKDETDAVTEDSLIGRIAVITLGRAVRGGPAQAKVKDQHGLTHYVMVEPDTDGVTFNAAQSVLLIAKDGSVFKAIENTNPALTDV